MDRAYTFVGHRGSSVVDYVLGSQDMFSFVKSFEVQGPNILSDHCLINFSFEFGLIQTEEEQSDDFEYMSEKYSWKNELEQEYTNCLGDEHTKAQLNLLE